MKRSLGLMLACGMIVPSLAIAQTGSPTPSAGSSDAQKDKAAIQKERRGVGEDLDGMKPSDDKLVDAVKAPDANEKAASEAAKDDKSATTARKDQKLDAARKDERADRDEREDLRRKLRREIRERRGSQIHRVRSRF